MRCLASTPRVAQALSAQQTIQSLVANVAVTVNLPHMSVQDHNGTTYGEIDAVVVAYKLNREPETRVAPATFITEESAPAIARTSTVITEMPATTSTTYEESAPAVARSVVEQPLYTEQPRNIEQPRYTRVPLEQLANTSSTQSSVVRSGMYIPADAVNRARRSARENYLSEVASILREEYNARTIEEKAFCTEDNLRRAADYQPMLYTVEVEERQKNLNQFLEPYAQGSLASTAPASQESKIISSKTTSMSSDADALDKFFKSLSQ